MYICGSEYWTVPNRSRRDLRQESYGSTEGC